MLEDSSQTAVPRVPENETIEKKLFNCTFFLHISQKTEFFPDLAPAALFGDSIGCAKDTVILKLTLRHKTDFTDRAAASEASAASARRFRSFRRFYVRFLISLISYLV